MRHQIRLQLTEHEIRAVEQALHELDPQARIHQDHAENLLYVSTRLADVDLVFAFEQAHCPLRITQIESIIDECRRCRDVLHGRELADV